MSELKEKFMLTLTEKLINEGVNLEIAGKIVEDVAGEYVGQPIQPLIDYYRKKHTK